MNESIQHSKNVKQKKNRFGKISLFNENESFLL